MKADRVWYVCVLVLCSNGLLLAAVSMWAQGPSSELEKVFSDWKKRQDKTVMYHLRGEVVIPKGSLRDSMGRPMPDAPPADVVSTATRTILFDFTNNRHRLEFEGQQYELEKRKLHPKFQVRVFDGKLIKAYRPRDRNTHPVDGVGPSDPELGIGKGYMGGGAFEMSLWPMFLAHGSVPSYYQRPIPGKLKVHPDSNPDLIYIHGKGFHLGRSCLVLRTRKKAQSLEEWWLDTERDSAVVRYVYYLTDKPHIDMEIEYENTANRWLPKQWTFTMLNNHSGKITYLERMRVNEVKLDVEVQDADFQIDEKPGMLIAKYEHAAPGVGQFEPEPKRNLYRVNEEGNSREVIFQDGVERPVPRFRWWWLLVAIPVLGLSVWLLRRWKLARQHGSFSRS